MLTDLTDLSVVVGFRCLFAAAIVQHVKLQEAVITGFSLRYQEEVWSACRRSVFFFFY